MTLPQFVAEMRVGSDPQIKFAQSGMAITSFSAVADKRKKNDESGEWETVKNIWVRVTAFKKLAENVAGSVKKGDLVLVVGEINQDEYEKDGEKRKSLEVVANYVGLSLTFNEATSSRGEKKAAPAEDPWSGGDESPF